jgi:ubiquinone/menaquinone biosynthesis C-methylase UbiE
VAKIDHAKQDVASEWNSIWAAKDVANEARSIDTQSVFFKTVADVLANVLQDGVILEGGCGLGRWLLHCQDKSRIIGLDRSESALRALKHYATTSVVVCGDVFQLPLRSGIVDCYLSFGVMEHFQGGPTEGLREAYRVLKPGGTLLISGPGASRCSLAELLLELSRLHLVRRVFHKPPIEAQTDFFQYRFRPDEMRCFLRDTGFRVLQTVTWGNLEILWQYFPPLRHPETRSLAWYNDMVMSGTHFRLTRFGMRLHATIRRFTPWLFHYAWLIQAVKPEKESEK